jgi:hypothetical protein
MHTFNDPCIAPGQLCVLRPLLVPTTVPLGDQQAVTLYFFSVMGVNAYQVLLCSFSIKLILKSEKLFRWSKILHKTIMKTAVATT